MFQRQSLKGGNEDSGYFTLLRPCPFWFSDEGKLHFYILTWQTQEMTYATIERFFTGSHVVFHTYSICRYRTVLSNAKPFHEWIMRKNMSLIVERMSTEFNRHSKRIFSEVLDVKFFKEISRFFMGQVLVSKSALRLAIQKAKISSKSRQILIRSVAIVGLIHVVYNTPSHY